MPWHDWIAARRSMWECKRRIRLQGVILWLHALLGTGWVTLHWLPIGTNGDKARWRVKVRLIEIFCEQSQSGQHGGSLQRQSSPHTLRALLRRKSCCRRVGQTWECGVM